MNLTKILTATVLASFSVSSAFAKDKCSCPNSDYQSARRILGKDFITPEEVATARFFPYTKEEEIVRRILDINDFTTPEEVAAVRYLPYTKEELEYFAKTLPAEETLHWAKKNNYAVVAGPHKRLDLKGVHLVNYDIKFFFFPFGDFREDSVRPAWLIIRKMPVPNSTNKNLSEQLQLLTKDEEVPNVAEISWFVTTFYKVRRVRLFKGIAVRIPTAVSFSGDHVFLQSQSKSELHIAVSSDGAIKSLGLAASRKLPPAEIGWDDVVRAITVPL